MTCIYFLKSGSCGFVLSPKYRNTKYIDFPEGSQFGVTDIIGSVLSLGDDEDLEYSLENWILYRDRLKRQFAVGAQTECEMLTLSIEDMYSMRSEFVEAYETLFRNAYYRLDRAHRLKLQAIKYCQKYMPKEETYNHSHSFFMRTFTMSAKKPKEFFFTPVDLREIDGSDMKIESEDSGSQ